MEKSDIKYQRPKKNNGQHCHEHNLHTGVECRIVHEQHIHREHQQHGKTCNGKEELVQKQIGNHDRSPFSSGHPLLMQINRYQTAPAYGRRGGGRSELTEHVHTEHLLPRKFLPHQNLEALRKCQILTDHKQSGKNYSEPHPRIRSE